MRADAPFILPILLILGFGFWAAPLVRFPAESAELLSHLQRGALMDAK